MPSISCHFKPTTAMATPAVWVSSWGEQPWSHLARAPAIPVTHFVTHTLEPGAAGPAPSEGPARFTTVDSRTAARSWRPSNPGTEPTWPSISAKPQLPIWVGDRARTVIDTTLKDGHALWVADVDNDGDDEVFAGYRGQGTSLIGYDFDGKHWNRTLIDSSIAAQDLRGGDIDGDGTPDFVGVGGSTHNVVWYRPKRD